MKTKFIAIFAGLTMLASMTAVSAAEAVQGEVAGNCPDGIKFVLNADSTETNKIVDIFYFGDELSDLSSYSMKISVPDGIVPVYTPAFDGTITNDSAAGLLNVLEADIKTTAWSADKKLGSFTLATAEGHGELRVELSFLDMYATDANLDTYEGTVYYDGTGEFDNGDASWLVIPAWTTGGGEEEVETTPAGFFKYWQNDTAAAAFTATLTADQAAKTVTWTVTDGEKTKTADTTVDTSVSGAGDVVIGLVISNAVEGLTATVTVK